MIRRIMLSVCALALAYPLVAGGNEPISGTVLRVDEPAGVIVLQDGRMYRVGGSRVVIVNDQPVAIATVQPGTAVVIRDAEPVRLENNRYTAMPQTRLGQGGDPVGEARTDKHATTVGRLSDAPVSGKVSRIDRDHRVVVFEDARMFRLTEDGGAVLVENRPVEFHTVQPGSHVMLRSAEPVELRGGQYVVITPGPSAAVTEVTPSASPATVTTVTPAPTTVAVVTPPAAVVTTPPTTPIVLDSVTTGTVRSFDPLTNVVVLSDGRAIALTPHSVVLVDGRPIPAAAMRNGMLVTLSHVNPIVYRDGRYALMNEGFRDDNGSLLAADAKYAGIEAELSDAAMQVQAGGGR